jgi:hypothetical protein
MKRLAYLRQCDEQNLDLARRVRERPWLFEAHLIQWSKHVLKRLGTPEEQRALEFDRQLGGKAMNETRPRRPMRLKEAFGVECWQCGQEIEIPCEPPHKCPHCGVLLEIEPREREVTHRGGCKSLPIQSR